MKTGSRGPHSSSVGTARELGQPERNVIERGSAGMARLQGNVGHELSDGPPSLRGGVRGPQRAANLDRDLRPGQRCGGAYERRGAYADQLPQHAAARQPDQRRRIRLHGDSDPGIGQDQPGDLIKVALRPAQRDGSAPVVRRQHHATGDSQLRGDGVEVIDPGSKGTGEARSLGVAHPKLVNRDDSPARVRAGQKPAPQIGPRRIAVHAEQGSHFWRDAVVEHVPGARHPFGVDGLDQSGPGRVDSRHSADLCDQAGLASRRLITRRFRRTRCSGRIRCPATGSGLRRAAGPCAEPA